jgi:hypothetical protein
MTIVMTLRLRRRYIPVRGSQDACLSLPPPSLTSHCYPRHPTHHLPTRAGSVGRPRHYTHNARLLLLSNYATLRSHLPNHLTLPSLRLSKHLHHLGAPSTPPIIHLLSLRTPPPTSFHCLMANFCLSSIVPRRFRTLSIPVQRID